MLWLGGCTERGPCCSFPRVGSSLCPFVRGSFLIPLLNGENSGAILLEERSWKIRQLPPSSKFLNVWRARILTQFA